MSKIYVVVSYGLEKDDEIVKAFKDIDDALIFMNDLEYEEDIKREISKKCETCSRDNKECPFYLEAYNLADGCENYDLHHMNTYYKVVKVDLEE